MNTAVAQVPRTLIADDQKFDLVLMDLNYARDTTSGKEGLDLISRIQDLDDDLPIIVMTGFLMRLRSFAVTTSTTTPRSWSSLLTQVIVRTIIQIMSILKSRTNTFRAYA